MATASNISINLRLNKTFTIEAWINRNVTGSSHFILGKHLASGNWVSYKFGIGRVLADKLFFSMQNNDLGQFPNWQSSTSLSADTWYHVVVVLNDITGSSTDVRAYVNGLEESLTFTANSYNSTFTLAYSAGSVEIGREANDVPRSEEHTSELQ